jgi:O-antigen/teichoic acid export membrane protein
MQYLKGVEKIKLYTFCSVFGTAVMLLLNILFLVVFRWGLVGYMLAISCSRILVIAVIFFTQRLWKSFANPFKIEKNLYKAILRYTVPMIPNSLSWWVSNSSDKYMIRAILSASAVGIYSVAYKIPTILTMFTTIFIAALQISSVEDFGSEKSRNFFSNTYKAFSSLGIVVSAILIPCSPLIAKILFQNDFFEAWKPSCILIVAFVFNALAGFLGTIYTASKKTGFLFYSTIIAASLNIVLNLILIPIIDIYGAALATLASYACVWLVRLIHSRKILPFRVNIWVDLISFILLGSEIFLMIYMDKLLNIPALLVMIVIVLLNTKIILQTGAAEKILHKFKRKKG